MVNIVAEARNLRYFFTNTEGTNVYYSANRCKQCVDSSDVRYDGYERTVIFQCRKYRNDKVGLVPTVRTIHHKQSSHIYIYYITSTLSSFIFHLFTFLPFYLFTLLPFYPFTFLPFTIFSVYLRLYVMQWTDRIRQVKFFLVIAAFAIAIASLYFSHVLTEDLKNEERHKMEVWSEAMRSLNMADDNTDLNLVLKVINENNTIPIVVLDKQGKVQTYRNITIVASSAADSLQFVSEYAKRLQHSNKDIRIYFNDTDKSDFIDVYYDDSVLLKRLAAYPYVQLGIVLIFVVVAIIALLTSKRAEQNKVWVGLSKETAHQLGTPISSLMAWIEILKETYPDDELIPEMDKDVKRLQLIADRFSKIGSLPEPVPTNLKEVLMHVVEYMDRRTSKKINITYEFPEHDIVVLLNSSLFEWVVENLCKNAVDAMGGEQGSIHIKVMVNKDAVVIEVSDTGKGIKKKDIGNVFRPGFTTKKRGWGLGLSLAKRIVEEYHHGKIFVKSSEVGKGTTFRIELKS